MANPEHFRILKSGIQVWNSWREDNSGVRPDLAGADLSGVNLASANLRNVDLREADLRTATLVRADLSGANLSGAILSTANLAGADLRAADLTETNLRGSNLAGALLNKAHLNGTIFSLTDLRGMDLTGAVLFGTVFGDVDLRSVQGLESVNHHGPSTIGIDVLYHSQGEIPEVFLRGAGISEELIAYARSFVGRPIQFYSCFISYSTKDEDFAQRLHGDLQNKGVRCWFAPHDMQSGKKLHDQIDDAIRRYDRLLLLLSDHSMNSEWVKTEIAHARQKELNENRQVLFPISLVPFESIRVWKNFDADTGKDSAREIREYFIPDFSCWKTDHDAYSKAFERLLKDLRAEKAAGA